MLVMLYYTTTSASDNEMWNDDYVSKARFVYGCLNALGDRYVCTHVYESRRCLVIDGIYSTCR